MCTSTPCRGDRDETAPCVLVLALVLGTSACGGDDAAGPDAGDDIVDRDGAPVRDASRDGTVCSADTTSDDPSFAAFLDQTKERMAEIGVPGAALMVYDDGEVTHEALLGVRERARCGPIGADTLFRSATVAGIVTGALLVESELDLEARLTDVLPGITFTRGDASAIRVRHLASHSAGLVWWDDYLCAQPGLHSVLGYLGTTPLQAEPGWLATWSGQNDDLVALALQLRLAGPQGGATFADAARSRVLDPLGMRSVYSVGELRDREHATAHWTRGAVVPDEELPDCEAAYPYEQLYVSLDDVERLVGWMLEDGRLLAAARANAVETTSPSITTSHGLRFQHLPDGTELVEVASVFRGYSSVLVMDAADGFAFAMLTNWDGPGQSRFLEETEVAALHYLHALDLPSWDDAIPRARWSEYVGTYLDPIGVEVPPASEPRTALVRWDEGRGVLAVSFDGAGARSLAPGITWMTPDGVDADAFTLVDADDGEHPVRFYRDAEGQVDRLFVEWSFGPPFYRVPATD